MAVYVLVTGPTGCLEILQNGIPGQVLGIKPDGTPGYINGPTTVGNGGISADGGNLLNVGVDGGVYMNSETIQDAIGLAISNGSGLSYNDVANAISALGGGGGSGGSIPIYDNSATDSIAGVINQPEIRHKTGAYYAIYRDDAGNLLYILVNTGTPLAYYEAHGDPGTPAGSNFLYYDLDSGRVWHDGGIGSVRVIVEPGPSSDIENVLGTGTDHRPYLSVGAVQSVIIGASADPTYRHSLISAINGGIKIRRVDGTLTASQTVTNVLALDNLDPVITGGTQILSASYSALESAQHIRVSAFVPYVSSSAAVAVQMNVWVGSECMGETTCQLASGANAGQGMSLVVDFESDNNSANTIQVRIGPASAATLTLNSKYNGLSMPYMTIEEISQFSD